MSFFWWWQRDEQGYFVWLVMTSVASAASAAPAAPAVRLVVWCFCLVAHRLLLPINTINNVLSDQSIRSLIVFKTRPHRRDICFQRPRVLCTLVVLFKLRFHPP